MSAFTDLREQLAQYLTKKDIQLVSQAYALANQLHDGQKRYTGEKYISHPVEVAGILASMHMDVQCIVAAILHDTIEDTPVTKDELSKQFGSKVADLVDGVSKLKQIRYHSRQYQQAENFRKMMFAMTQDIRVILIKLADRLHNMRTLGTLPAEKKRRVSIETLEIYAPIAHRLGMNWMRIEFEELGFANAYPYRYRVLKDAIKNVRSRQKKFLQTIEKTLAKAFKTFKLKPLQLLGREKHLYSIYRKMRAKNVAFTNIMDVYAFRIIVPQKMDCYRALGIVHESFSPMAGRFKDYIAMPKPNGYQSLHTTCLGPQGVPIEVQIRDQQMDKIAQNGIASHWLYKDPGQVDASEVQHQAEHWLASLMEIQRKTNNPLEFIENVKIDLYPDEIFVFTPKGNIMPLPQGATVVDFAYAVHTDVGNSCVGCRINREIAGLSTPLRSGQTVEVITAKGARPNPNWLNFTVTGKARTNIRHWVKDQEKSESTELGRRLVNGILAAQDLSLEKFKAKKLKKIAVDLGYDSLDGILQDAGMGKFKVKSLVECLIDEKPELTTEADVEPLVIRGTEGMVVRFAPCCAPIPGDFIQAFISDGRGVVIHRLLCPKIQKWRKQTDRCIPALWEKDIDNDFQVPVIVDVQNGRGVLADLATNVAQAAANITNVRVEQNDGVHNTVVFHLCVKSRSHLAKVVRRLRTLPEVIRVSRG